jgi:hypothetical protein
MINQSISK